MEGQALLASVGWEVLHFGRDAVEDQIEVMFCAAVVLITGENICRVVELACSTGGQHHIAFARLFVVQTEQTGTCGGNKGEADAVVVQEDVVAIGSGGFVVVAVVAGCRHMLMRSTIGLQQQDVSLAV